jgi:methylenetetrahydrofolate dehydrogenase (NADP+) / methenyltetrahydrofolate cyclohydrolase
MNTIIIDEKVASERLCRSIADEVTNFRDKHGIRPGLAVVFVGNDSASEVYVRTKARQTNAVGMLSFTHRLPTETSQDELLKLLHLLNTDPEIDGILVQLPLPAHIDVQLVIAAIQPDKDVDGFHPINAGLVMTGGGGIVPCTPLACLKLIKSIRTDLAGLNALVVGCSNIVGKPMAQLLLAEYCTVTSAHVKTRNSSELCRQADILVVAVGRPGLVRGDWIKPGAIVIDVGINRLLNADGQKGRIVGDIVFDEAKKVAGAITPVPGGVGPMTIACLLQNTLQVAKRRRAHAAITIGSPAWSAAFEPL